MESRKMVLMDLFVGQEWRCRLRGQTVDTVRDREGGVNLESSFETYAFIYDTCFCLYDT